MAIEVFSDRALNRATMRRQLLDRRAGIAPLDAVRHLVGLQGQAANAPYLGLWARVEGFARDDLIALLDKRLVVRAGLLRGTQHLATAEDYRWLRPLIQPVADRARQAAFGRRTAGIDMGELREVAYELLKGRVLTRPQLRDLLAARWPGADAEALAWSAQCLLPLVHPPPAGIWGRGGATPFALAEEWLGRPVDPAPRVDEVVLRYLAAFGPASVADVQAWSGLTRLAEVVERLPLREFRDARGRSLFDLPDAPRPDEQTPLPVRLLPDFDNLIVAYADRTRLMPDDYRRRVCIGSLVKPTVLVDGRVVGNWQWRAGAVALDLFEPVDVADLSDEIDHLTAFAA
jgi:hypothetical protein